MKNLYCLLLLIFLPLLVVRAQQSPDLGGRWQGHIDIQGVQLIIRPHFQQSDSGYTGTIDIPQQMASGLPLQTVSMGPADSLYFAFAAGPGLAEFRGSFSTDSSITGTFYQSGRQFPFMLNRMEDDTSRREQSPPYRIEELTIGHDSLTIGGTLTRPQKESASPLVILISGSGAQNRDEEIMGFKPFALIADHLTRNGIATFRFDDRGVGRSTGRFAEATLDMLASDVKTIIRYFEESSAYPFPEIILLGHSQGGIVAGKTATEMPAVDKLILMASPGRSLQDVLRYQVRHAFGETHFTEQDIAQEVAARDRVMEAIRSGGNVEKAKAHYRAQYLKLLRKLPEQQQKQIGDLQAFAKRQAEQLTAAFRTPQMQSLLWYDPTSDLRSIERPVLVLFGKKDTQITIGMHKQPIVNALEKGEAPYRVVEFENANHLFQKAETGAPGEYGQLEEAFVDGFLSTIERWIAND